MKTFIKSGFWATKKTGATPKGWIDLTKLIKDNSGGASENYIEVTKDELDNLISSSQLSKSSLYKISGVNPDLYGGTTIFLTAIENNKLSTDGYGIFYNPKYDKSIDGFGIVKDYYHIFWDTESHTESGVYNIGDRVIWGGKHWNCISPTLVDTKYIFDKFSLDTAYFEEIPFNETDYNVVHDKIKYDYEHDLIVERIEQNSNIVSFNFESLKSLFNKDYNIIYDSYFNPIKNFQWGNLFHFNPYEPLNKGIGNNKIIDSLNENINFSGICQINITFINSYKKNLISTNNIYHKNIIYNGYTFDGYDFDVSEYPVQNNQENLVYDGLVYRNDSYLGIGDNQSLSTLSIKTTGSLSTNKVLKINNNSNTLLELNGAGGLGIGVSNNSSSTKIAIKSKIDAVVLSNELLTSTGWTSTGWAGDFTTGFTHATGNTSILSHTLGGSTEYIYRIEITISNRTAGSINVSFGGITKTSITLNQIIAQRGLNTSKLQITPTSDFDGTVIVSIKRVNSGSYPSTISLINSLEEVVGEIRTSRSSSNSFFGIFAGGYNFDGTANSFFGSDSGGKNLSGKSNSFFGYLSGNQNVKGSYNSYFGTESGENNLGSENSFFGYQSGIKISNGSILNNSNSSVFIGYDTRANADNETNQIVIGHSAIGNGSNSVTIGNDSITKTILKGSVGIGGITTPGARLDVKAQGALSTDIAFRVRNSTDTQNFLVVNGAGDVYNNGAGGINTNTFFGENVGRNTTGGYNTAIGLSALQSNTTGFSNTAIGISALRNNTTGGYNTAIGTSALRNNTTGFSNTAIGIEALQSNTTGFSNTAIGLSALQSNTTGGSNTAIGLEALRSNTTGGSNTAIGLKALQSNTTGFSNTAIGTYALQSNTTGFSNTAIGLSALRNNTTGGYNTAIGLSALLNNTTGGYNTAIGLEAGRSISDGSSLTIINNSIFIGFNTRALADNQTNQIVIGHQAIGLGSNSVVLGNDSITKTILKGSVGIGGITTPGARLDVKAQGALSTDIAFRVRNSADTQDFLVVTGAGEVYNRGAKGNEFSTFFGQYSGINSTGGGNNAFGRSALTSNTTGHSNSAFGNNVLQDNTTGYCNNAFGVQSLIRNTTGTSNNAFGYNTLESNTIGKDNSAFGGFALGNNTTGNDNTAVGSNALQDNTTGNQNVGLGYGALLSNTTGNQNVSLGVEAGRRLNDGDNSYNTISSNSIYLGYDTRAKANNETNQIVIGHSARGDGSNSVVLGNSSITRTRLQGQVIIGSFTTQPSGIEGAIYYNSTDKKHYGFNGTTWNALY